MSTGCSRRVSIALGLCSWSIAAWAAGGHGAGAHGASGASSIDTAKTVHVSAYERRDGTHVQSYYRSLPGTILPGSVSPSRARSLPVSEANDPFWRQPASPPDSPSILGSQGSRRAARAESSAVTGSVRRSAGPLLAETAARVELAGQEELRAWILAQRPSTATPVATQRRAAPVGIQEWAAAFRAQMLPVASAARRLEVDRSASSCQALSAAVKTASLPPASKADLSHGAASALRWYSTAAEACSQGLEDLAAFRLDRASQEVLALQRSLGQ